MINVSCIFHMEPLKKDLYGSSRKGIIKWNLTDEAEILDYCGWASTILNIYFEPHQLITGDVRLVCLKHNAKNAITTLNFVMVHCNSSGMGSVDLVTCCIIMQPKDNF